MTIHDLDRVLEDSRTWESLGQWAIDRQPTEEDFFLYFRDDAVQVQSNLSLRECKFVFYVLAMIDPGNPVMPSTFRLDVRRFAELNGLDLHSLWKQLKDITGSLFTKHLTVNGTGVIFPDDICKPNSPFKPGHQQHRLSWLSRVGYYDERRYLVVELAPGVVYLWNEWLCKKLRDKSFTMSCGLFFKLRSIYSTRLYTYLSGRRDEGVVRVSLSRLREILVSPQDSAHTPPLSQYKNFKLKAIEPALLEINTGTDLEVTCEEINSPGSKAITELVFTVQKKPANGHIQKPELMNGGTPATRLALPDKEVAPPIQRGLGFETKPDSNQLLARIRQQWGLTARQVDDLQNALLEKGPDFVLGWEKQAQSNGKNPVALFCDAMRTRRPLTNGHQGAKKIRRNDINWDWKAFLIKKGMVEHLVPKSLGDMSDRMFKNYIAPEQRKRLGIHR